MGSYGIMEVLPACIKDGKKGVERLNGLPSIA